MIYSIRQPAFAVLSFLLYVRLGRKPEHYSTVEMEIGVQNFTPQNDVRTPGCSGNKLSSKIVASVS